MRLVVLLVSLMFLSFTTAVKYEAPVCKLCVCSFETVNCFNKSLQNINLTFPHNTKLLNLSHNLITEITNDAFLSGSSLKILDISFNNISKLYNRSFIGLSRLKSLFIQNNHLTLNDSLYPIGVFKPLINLQTLNISNNVDGYYPSDTYPEQALGDLINLSDLSIDGIFVPRLGKRFLTLRKLQTLTFAGNCRVQEILKNSLIAVPNLKRLTVSHCRLHTLDPHAFKYLEQLEYLDLSYNIRLGFENATLALENLHSSLKYLNLAALVEDFQTGVILKISHVKRLQHLPITQLFLDSNRIELVDTEAIPCLPPNVTMVSFCDNKPTGGNYMLAGYYMKQLTTLNASRQYSSHISSTTFKDTINKRSLEQFTDMQGSKVIQRFKEHLFGRPNAIIHTFSKHRKLQKQRHQIELPPVMTFFNFSYSTIRYLVPEIRFGQNILKTLDLSGKELHKWIGPITGLDRLEWLDLSLNLCNFISKDFLGNLTALQTLNISSNYLATSLHDDEDGEIFQNAINLKLLRISDNKLRVLPKNLLKNLVHLRELDLSHNTLSTFSLKINHMTQLEILDLSDNVLTTLPKSFRQFCDDQHKVNKTLSVNLSGQILSCTCDNLDFLKWMNTKTTDFIDRNSYTCIDTHSKEISMVNLEDIINNLQIKCASHTVLVVVLTVSIALIITIVVASFVYKYRWKLRYVYYLTRSKFRGYSAIGGAAQNRFDFDAFVSYADEDRRVVVNDMVTKLEQEQGTQLCIHHRDFLVGEEIAANILNAVRNSKKMVIVLSNNFIASYWCNYELNMAHMESLETGRNVIIVVVYDHVPMKELPDILKTFMKNNSYIEYTDDPQGNIIFWDQLNTAINSD